MKVKRMIESDVDTFKVGDVIEVKLADKKRPDFYKLDLSYADLNGTYSDAYLQIDISFYYKTYSGGYNYTDLFFAEYHNDTGWFIRTAEGEKFQQEK